MIGWIIFLAVVWLAVTSSPWWWLLAVPLGLWRLTYFMTYRSRPWRKLHFPLMRAYAAAMGSEVGATQVVGESPDIKRALATMVQATLRMAPSDATQYVAIQLSRGLSELDRPYVEAEFRRRKLSEDPALMKEALDDLVRFFASGDPGVQLRLVIAGIIEQLQGPASRAEYLVAIAKGDAT